MAAMVLKDFQFRMDLMKTKNPSELEGLVFHFSNLFF